MLKQSVHDFRLSADLQHRCCIVSMSADDAVLTCAAPRPPACGVAPSVACASCSAARRRVLRPTAPRPASPAAPPYLPKLPHDPAREPCGRRVAPSAVLRERSTSAEHSCGYRNGQIKTSSVPNGRGHLDLLREFGHTAFPLTLRWWYSIRNGSRIHAAEGVNKRSANARPSEGTSSDSDSDPGSGDSPDHSGFTTVRRRRAAKGSKPKAAGLTQTSDGSMC
ncbi:hypothetical protein EVAR_67994_1 [Eumeta japonica]|uniref:Uncharacterized protein n=1 Tax=Eumeta variegata TaxID=151549 RepID=A0A4C2A9X6_EUMVA|nr:hypothetical protein EVAR_67994_1 [Eumeta japonica]